MCPASSSVLTGCITDGARTAPPVPTSGHVQIHAFCQSLAATTIRKDTAHVERVRIQAGSRVELSLNPVFSLISLEQVVR